MVWIGSSYLHLASPHLPDIYYVCLAQCGPALPPGWIYNCTSASHLPQPPMMFFGEKVWAENESFLVRKVDIHDFWMYFLIFLGIYSPEEQR